MLNRKCDVDGFEVGGPSGTYWLSPQRDLATNVPIFIHKALDYCTNIKTDPVVADFYAAGGTVEDLNEYAKAMANYVKMATDPSLNIKVKQAFEDCGITKLKQATHNVMNHAFTRVVLSYYWYACGEAMGGTFKPFVMLGTNDIPKFFESATAQ